MFSHGPAIRLEDDRLGGRRTDHFRQPAQMGRPPGGTAPIPDILAQQEGLQSVLGGLAIPDRILTRTGQVTDRLVLDRRHKTGVKAPERISRASWVASRRSVLTRSPTFFGTREGATTQQCRFLRLR